MKVLLVYPSHFPGGRGVAFPMPPLSVLHLAGMAREAGHDVDLLEPSAYGRETGTPDRLNQRLSDVDLLALSCTSITWGEGLRFISQVRTLRPELPIVIGGVHASRYDAHLLSHGWVDFVVRGEGERGWLELLARLQKGPGASFDDVPGLSMRDGKGGVARQPDPELLTDDELGRLALPAYDLVPEDTYAILPFESSRGCPFNCAFCSIIHQRGWRAAGSDQVFDRLARIVDTYGDRFTSKTVCLVDDCFTADAGHVQRICQSLGRSGLGRSLMIEARVTDLLKEGVLDSLLQIELAEIQIGVECGYDEGLHRLRKGLRVSQIRDCAARLQAAGIAGCVMYSLILGLPWETEEHCRRTLELGAELSQRWGGVVNFSWWIPLPSFLWDHREDYDISIGDDMYDQPAWAENPRTFWATHPLLSPESVTALRQSANVHRRSGARLFGI